MTNEEIRLNRYCKHCRDYDKGCGWLCRRMICQAADAYETALDEKDQQFKEYLERKIITINSTDYDSCWELLNEIINELFNEK